MAIAKKCDLCLALYEPYNTANNQKEVNGFTLLNIDNNTNFYSHKIVDCCPTCMNSILKHIEYLKGES